MKKITIILCLMLAGCTQPKTMNMYDGYSLTAGFDTFMYLQGNDTSKEAFDEKFNEFVEKTYYHHQLFDKYHNYEGINNIKTINDSAGIKPVKVDEPMMELILLAKEYNQFSHGKFDITMGPVLEIWHEVREKAGNSENVSLPDLEQLQKAQACTGWDKVEIDEENQTIYLNESCASLDVGGIAKGFTAEKMALHMQQLGIDHGYINAGGNIRVIGNKLNGEGYVVGAQVPIAGMEKESLAAITLVDNQSMVTSGSYQRYMEIEGKRYHHIIDPDTLYPSAHASSVTIVADDSGLADIFSTMFYTCSYEEGVALAEEIKKLGIDIDIVWIYENLDEIENANYQIINLSFTDGSAKNYYVLTTNQDKIQVGHFSVK